MSHFFPRRINTSATFLCVVVVVVITRNKNNLLFLHSTAQIASFCGLIIYLFLCVFVLCLCFEYNTIIVEVLLVIKKEVGYNSLQVQQAGVHTLQCKERRGEGRRERRGEEGGRGREGVSEREKHNVVHYSVCF